MTAILRFWRDVEIFNIPDAPTPRQPGRAGFPPPEEVEPDVFPIDASTAAGTELPARPRGRVVHRLPATAGQGEREGMAVPPLLPWRDPRFLVQEEIGGAPASQAREDGPRPPADYAHAVYIGVGQKQAFVEFILATHGIEGSGDELNRPVTGQGWLAAFIVNGRGAPLRRTYVAASFAVGSALLRAGQSLDAASHALSLQAAAFDERMDERRQQLAHDNPEALFSLDWEDIADELHAARRPLLADDDEPSLPTPWLVVESVPLYRRKDGSLNPPPEQAATFLNSFFIDDLTTLIQSDPATFGAALARYLGPDSPVAERLDLLADARALAAHVSPASIPAGRWNAPPREPLALAQQAAVYQVMQGIGAADGLASRGLMAVNGPPGTGKTTLLKDLIADVVVQRAQRLSVLADPADLFTTATVRVSGGDEMSSVAPAIRADIVAGTEIVVTSSNNAAVQNISFELPFSGDAAAFPEAAYLAEVAACVAEKFKLPRKNPWGLLAVALGAKPNREKVATALMGYEPAFHPSDPTTHPVAGQPASLKPWLDQARRGPAAEWRQRWFAARDEFLQRSAAVEDARAQLVAVQEALLELPQMPARRERHQAALAERRAERRLLQQTGTLREAAYEAQAKRDGVLLQSLADQGTTLDRQHAALAEKLADIRAMQHPGWLAQGIKKLFGVETAGYRRWRDGVEQARAALEALDLTRTATAHERAQLNARIAGLAQGEADARQLHAVSGTALDEAVAVLASEAAALDERERTLQQVLAHALANTQGDAPTLPDERFLALSAADRQRSSLWVSESLDRARTELFLAALRLHEATLMANAGAWFAVLRVLRAMLTGQAQPQTKEDMATLWHSLFFVVPVVSTTLASFGRLFQGMEGESLGWVLVDEAGQAHPASVAGALWRARRAVLVGDPLQIEPVVTVPRDLVTSLARKRGLDDDAVLRWSPSVQSAQTLADRTMRLGAQVGQVWTGLPLRTHRRCMSPMFDIANRIAYDGQMVQATVAKEIVPDPFASCWIDVKGSADGKVVDAEITALCRLLETFLLDWPQVVNGRGERANASVYIIAPFRDVAEECKGRIKSGTELGRRFDKHKLVVDAGTVHTFQGKEASIVFLVLGSAPGDAGAGSRRWAAGKPNLLNVAVTRAQQRLYVIGSHADWTVLPFFDQLAEGAGHLPRARIAVAPDSGRARLVPA